MAQKGSSEWAGLFVVSRQGNELSLDLITRNSRLHEDYLVFRNRMNVGEGIVGTKQTEGRGLLTTDSCYHL